VNGLDASDLHDDLDGGKTGRDIKSLHGFRAKGSVGKEYNKAHKLQGGVCTMSAKELALEALRKLPEDVSLERIIEELAILAALRRGREAIASGDVISHEDLANKSASWISRP
jgi:hypothetical protein